MLEIGDPKAKKPADKTAAKKPSPFIKLTDPQTKKIEEYLQFDPEKYVLMPRPNTQL